MGKLTSCGSNFGNRYAMSSDMADNISDEVLEEPATVLDPFLSLPHEESVPPLPMMWPKQLQRWPGCS